MQEKIIVLGYTGMLGRYVYDYLKYKCNLTVIGLSRKELDATNIPNARHTLEYLIRNEKITIIINCMGVTNKRNDLSLTEMYMVNGVFPHVLDRICLHNDIKLLQPSTDCVFNGLTGHYEDDSIKDAYDDYGLSKSIGEEIYGSVIRTSIIGEEANTHSNLLSWCISKKNQSVRGYEDHFWNGITCLEWAKLAYDIITQNLWWKGIKTYTSIYFDKDFVSKKELIECIDLYYQLNLTIEPVKTYEYRRNRVLCGEKIKKPLQDQIKELSLYCFHNK